MNVDYICQKLENLIWIIILNFLDNKIFSNLNWSDENILTQAGLDAQSLISHQIIVCWARNVLLTAQKRQMMLKIQLFVCYKPNRAHHGREKRIGVSAIFATVHTINRCAEIGTVCYLQLYWQLTYFVGRWYLSNLSQGCL